MAIFPVIVAATTDSNTDTSLLVTVPADADGMPGCVPVLCNYPDGHFNDRNIQANVWHEAKTLRLRFSIPLRDDYEQASGLSGRDQAYHREDSVELLFRPGGELRHFVFNVAGDMLDRNEAMGRDWNSHASAKAMRADNTWTLDIIIPFDDLDIDEQALPVEMPFTAVVRVQDPLPGNAYIVTAQPCVERQFAHIKNMGILRITKGTPYITDFAVAFSRTSGRTTISGLAGLRNPADKPLRMDSSRGLLNMSPDSFHRYRYEMVMGKDIEPYTVRVGDIFRFSCMVNDPYRLDVSMFRYGEDEIRLRLIDPDKARQAADQLQIEIAGKEYGPVALDKLPGFIIPVSHVPPGDYVVEYTFYKNGDIVHTDRKQICRIDETPIPFDLKSLDVSKYYPPVQVEKNQVAAALSRFTFDKGILPSNIDVKERGCVATNIGFFAGGRSVDFPKETIQETHRNYVKISGGTARCGSVDITTNAQLDYDGLLWVRGKIHSTADKTSPCELRIPLCFKGTSIFYNYSARVYDSQMTPEGVLIPSNIAASVGWGKRLPEGVTYVELCAGISVVDDFGGLSVYLPPRPASLELEHYDRIVKIHRKGQNVTLTLNLAEGKTDWRNDEIPFDFGLQPLPIRTLCNDYMQSLVRKMHRLYYETNIEKVNTHNALIHVVQRWTELQSYFDTVKYRDKLSTYAPATKARNMKLLTYLGFEMSDQVPEAPLYMDTCQRHPVNRPWIRKDTPGQRSYAVCYSSLWGDYYLRQIDNMLSKYGQEGVYMDGTLYPQMCSSPYHGHRTTDSRGRVVPCINTLDMRRFSQILYQIGQKHSDDFIQDLHASSGGLFATTGLVTNLWNGEQSHIITGAWRVPQDTLRATFNGRVFGVPVELLTMNVRDWECALSETLPFDTLPRTQTGRSPLAQKIHTLWDLYDELNLTRDTFTGFWMPEANIRDTAGNALVSYYDTPAHLVLVVSSYPHRSPIQARLQFGEHAATIDPAGREVFDREGSYAVQNGGLQLDIEGEDFRMIVFTKDTQGQ